MYLLDIEISPDIEADSHGHRRFDPGSAYFAVALGGVAITDRKQRLWNQNWKPRRRSGDEILCVDVSGVLPRGKRVEPPGFGRSHPDDTGKGCCRDGDVADGIAAFGAIELPVSDEWGLEFIGEQSEVRYVAALAPSLVLDVEDLHLQHVPRFGSPHCDRSG